MLHLFNIDICLVSVTSLLGDFGSSQVLHLFIIHLSLSLFSATNLLGDFGSSLALHLFYISLSLSFQPRVCWVVSSCCCWCWWAQRRLQPPSIPKLGLFYAFNICIIVLSLCLSAIVINVSKLGDKGCKVPQGHWQGECVQGPQGHWQGECVQGSQGHRQGEQFLTFCCVFFIISNDCSFGCLIIYMNAIHIGGNDHSFCCSIMNTDAVQMAILFTNT